MTTKTSRSHETRIEIDAPIEEVWKAITDAAAMARWFAPKMTVEPGVGGYILADWGPGVEWTTAIEVWEPNKHLRLTENRDRVMSASPIEEKLEMCRLVEDFYLETAGGKTVLRLVHSGFGSSQGWDMEYEGTRGGWAGCFLRLKLGLEAHRDERVHNIAVNIVCDGVDYAQAMKKIEAAAPEPFESTMHYQYQISGFLTKRNGSLLTLSCQRSPTGSVAYLEFTLYGQTDADAKSIENAWRTAATQAVAPS
jgi:uncharacterized protein YndB with AHSA1/START domain